MKRYFLSAVVWAVFSIYAVAQTPQVSETVPAESFLGEPFCFETNFSNSGAPGFGPYVRLELPPELIFDSASIFGGGAGIENVGVFPPAPGNQLDDPNIDQAVTGTPGNSLIILNYPVGSVVTGGPDLPIEICLTIASSADVGASLPIDLTPVYEFGDTATGDNGPIVGAVSNQNVIPTVLLFDKSDNTPESERPPGTSWPYQYTLSVDIANTATINPLVIRDTLPADFQFNGTFNIVGGVGCAATQTPSTVTPGGVIEVTCTGNTVGAAGGGDVTVTYSGSIIDTLDETVCTTEDQINAVSAEGTYVPPSGPVQPLPAILDSTTVVAKHVAVQKGVSPGAASPGAALTYSLNFQVTDFGDANALVVTDTIPDGIDFVSHGSLTVNSGGAIAITPAVTVNGDFTTTVVYDIAAAAGTLAAGSAITLSYDAVIRQDYQDTGEPVLSSDSLNNSVVADYDLVQGASACADGSGASVDILPVVIDKEIINVQPFYVPGEQVQFRLTLNVPAGDTQNIVFEDFQPLPVIDVNDLDLTFGSGDIVPGPGDTAGLTPTGITVDPAQNSLTINWPDLSSTTPQVIQVDVFATINDDPFADGLFLTNILNVSTNNTPGVTAISTGPVTFQVGAPDLVITKGVSATDGNGSISPSAATLPVDGDITDVDAGDQITYLITVENIGSAQAFDVLISDPFVSELTGCSVASVTDGTGSPLANSGDLFTTGLTLTDPLAANDENPAGGGAPFAADTVLVTVNCTVAADIAPNASFTNTASANWASQPGANDFPPQTNDATATATNIGQQKYFIDSSEEGTSDTATPPRVTIGEIVRYRLAVRIPEGEISNFTVRDNLPAGLTYLDDFTARTAFVSDGPNLSSSAVATTITGSDPDPSVVPSSAVTTLIEATGGPFTDGTDPVFSFGTITNAENDANDEFLLIEFNALVSNIGGNNISVNRNNTFISFSEGTALDGNSNSVQVRIAEPQLTVNKSSNPTIADAGDMVTFTVVVANGGGSNNSSAYEVVLDDPLPTGLEGLTAISSTPSGCPGLGAADNSAGDTLNFTFAEMVPGCSVEISFQATMSNSVAPGTVITNVANAIWTSLPGASGTGPNPTGSTVPGGSGDPTGERNGSGGVNDYDVDGSTNITVPSVGILKAVTATSDAGTDSSEFRSAVDDLVIGEQATFTITVVLPEGTVPQVVVTDTLPFTNGVMRLDSASVISVGANLTPDILSPVASISDAQLSDGIDDTASFDFGQVVNTPDGVGNADDNIVIEVVATLVNAAANSNGDALTNTALVQFGPGLNASAPAGIDVVEPILEIQKDGSITQGDAGDPVTYTVTINHSPASAADAQDLVFQDPLPAGLTLNVGSIAVVSGPNFDVNTSSGNTVSLGWTDLLQAETIVLEYQATLTNTVAPGDTVTNTANIEWTSIAGPNPDERTNDVSNAHQILITQPGLGKLVFATSQASTDAAEFGSPDDLTIGEQVTYRFTVIFPEGTSSDAVVTDQLPVGSSVLQVVSSEIISIGGNLSGGSLPAVGAAGVASDSNADTFNDRVTWTLGEVLNTPDGAVSAADEIEFEVVAVVLDVAANQSGDVDQLNTATLTTASSTVSGTAPVDLVAPDVDLSKTVTDPADGFVDAGDTVTVRLEIDHSADSTADAFNLILTDTLPTGLSWAGDGTVNSDCTGLVTDSSGAPIIGFSVPTLDLTTDTCFIEYQVTVDAGVSPGQTLQNSAVLDYDSTPVFVAGQTRRNMGAATAEVTVLAPGLVKVAAATSQPDTELSQGDPTLLDLTIGETVTYELTLVFPEGVTSNAVLTDLMPISPGLIEAIGATVTAVGGNISTTLPGTPVFSDTQLADGFDDTVTLDFGDVTNTADGIEDANDRIVVQIVGRVVDAADNANGDVLANNATLNFDGDGGGLNGSAAVEVVEPVTNLTKSMTLGEDGLVTITLTVENTGTAPAYDLRVIDVFDEAVWDLSGYSDVTVPTGFELNLLPATPAVGQQTVEFQTDPGASSPDGTIPVGASVSVIFEIPLAVLPPDPNPVENRADQVGGDTLPGDDPNERDLPPDDDTAQLGVPDLTLSKSAALLVDADVSSSVSPGDTLRYTLVLENNGVAEATNIVIDDVPDANTALVVGSVTTSSGTVNVGNTAGDSVVQVGIPSLAAAGSVTITYDTVINNPLPVGVEQVVNQAVFDSTELPPGESDDPTPPGPDDPTIVPLGNTAPDLTLVKDDGGASALAGGTVVWTLDYANVGNQDATGVEISDIVPLNTVFNAGASTAGWACLPDNNAGSNCTFAVGNLNAGDNGSVNFAVTVDDPLPAGVDEVVNTASIVDDGTNGPDPTPENNGDSDTTPITAAPDLTIIKDDGDITAEPGGLIVYTLEYENVGTQGATSVTIGDVVPDNTTFVPGASTAGWICSPNNSAGSNCAFSIGSLPAGDSGSIVFAVQLNDPIPLDFTSVPNTAAIEDDGQNGPDPTPDDNTDTENTPVTINPALGIVKVLSDAPDPIVAGSVLEYTITATNIGNMTLTNVVVSDDLITPTGGTTPCASVAPGGICTLIGTYLVTPGDVENGQIVNNAEADSDQTEPVGTTVTTPVPQNPALDLVKQAVLDDINGNGLGDAGETINYTITTTNIGDVTLNNVVVVDPLLGTLVCDPAIPATLAPTETIVCTGSYLIEIVDLNSAAITNVATATGEGPGGTPVDDGDTAITVLNAPMVVPTLSIWALLVLSLSLLLLGSGAQLRRS